MTQRSILLGNSQREPQKYLALGVSQHSQEITRGSRKAGLVKTKCVSGVGSSLINLGRAKETREEGIR